MTSRQSRLRERRKAEGGKQLTCLLSSEGARGLEEIRKDRPDLTIGEIVSRTLFHSWLRSKERMS